MWKCSQVNPFIPPSCVCWEYFITATESKIERDRLLDNARAYLGLFHPQASTVPPVATMSSTVWYTGVTFLPFYTEIWVSDLISKTSAFTHWPSHYRWGWWLVSRSLHLWFLLHELFFLQTYEDMANSPSLTHCLTLSFWDIIWLVEDPPPPPSTYDTL